MAMYLTKEKSSLRHIACLLAVVAVVAGCSHVGKNPLVQPSRLPPSPSAPPELDTPPETTPNPIAPDDATPSGDVMKKTETSEAGKEITTFMLTGKNFAFMMEGKEGPEMRVKLGDTVKVQFTSESGFHDWKLDEFNAATEKVQTSGSTSVEFVANKKGTFEYYCSVGAHRQNGMKGKFIVE